MWRVKLEAFLSGQRLERSEKALGRSPGDYEFDPRNIARIPESDMEGFFRTLELGVLTELPNGDFLTGRKGAAERLYSHGSKSKRPTMVGIAVEGVISIAAIGRLIEQFGWPPDCLGSQTGNWKFDLTCYRPASAAVAIQCEVKRSVREIDRMCDYMEAITTDLPPPSAAKGSITNWDRKLDDLQNNPPEVFWALGPGGYCRVYRIDNQSGDGQIRLKRGAIADLYFPADQSRLGTKFDTIV